MPLHTLPLCSLKYAGDTLSSATFQYDTIECINKSDNRLLYCEENNVIVKNQNKSMYTPAKIINKVNTKLLQPKLRNINMISHKELRSSDKSILKSDSRSLIGSDLLINQVSSNLSLISLYNPNIIQSSITKSLSTKLVGIQLAHDIELSNMNDVIINKECELNLISANILDLGKNISKNLRGQNLNTLNSYSTKSLKNNDLEIQLKFSNSYEYIHDDKLINPYHEYRMFGVINDNKLIAKNLNNHYAYRYVPTQIFPANHINFLEDLSIVQMYSKKVNKLIYNISIDGLLKHNLINSLDRIDYKYINKDHSIKHFYRQVIKSIYHGKEKGLYRDILVDAFKLGEHYLDREILVNTFKINPNYLDREILVDMFKDYQKYINNISIVPISNHKEKGILNISMLDVYHNHNKLIQGITESITKYNSTQFIEVTHRWWWLNPTNPTDRLIVPNRDYGNMSDLLSNPHFEYLRYNNHPIEWGSSWGKDSHIPPHAISVEIMLDVVNIITMIWHNNTQGWLNVSGREAIQLLMELLYDWYSMNTSSPNSDYYRTYRWIRWEAEKVYFLNNQNGLQAMGILIANLRDYLKFHHFNKVPLCQNIKAMDEERNFNKLATNHDLMINVDKNKGKRHYFIETQNFEKKDIFRR